VHLTVEMFLLDVCHLVGQKWRHSLHHHIQLHACLFFPYLPLSTPQRAIKQQISRENWFIIPQTIF
jgi:hypothetical protein